MTEENNERMAVLMDFISWVGKWGFSGKPIGPREQRASVSNFSVPPLSIQLTPDFPTCQHAEQFCLQENNEK